MWPICTGLGKKKPILSALNKKERSFYYNVCSSRKRVAEVLGR